MVQIAVTYVFSVYNGKSVFPHHTGIFSFSSETILVRSELKEIVREYLDKNEKERQELNGRKWVAQSTSGSLSNTIELGRITLLF